jgi:hypothetical protein
MRIGSKAEFYRLWEAGVLGNKPETWREIGPALKANIRDYALREVGAAGGGKFEICPSRLQLMSAVMRWNYEGRRWVITGVAPNHLSQLQGEICCTERGLEGFLGVRTGVNMREAMAQGLLLPRSPAVTRTLMRHFIDPASLDDIDELLERYPDAAIEFCSYSVNVGVIPGRNTLIWEVRDY